VGPDGSPAVVVLVGGVVGDGKAFLDAATGSYRSDERFCAERAAEGISTLCSIRTGSGGVLRRI